MKLICNPGIIVHPTLLSNPYDSPIETIPLLP